MSTTFFHTPVYFCSSSYLVTWPCMNILSEKLPKPTQFMYFILDFLLKISTTNRELPASLRLATYVHTIVLHTNSLEKAKLEDPKFVKQVKAQSFKMIYDYMQQKHIKLMSCLESLPKEYHKLPFYAYFTKTIPIVAFNKEDDVMLWHQRLIHCRSHFLKNASLHVDGVPNLSSFNFDDVLKWPTCLKTNLTKNFGKKSLCNTVKRLYQGLFIDFSFSG